MTFQLLQTNLSQLFLCKGNKRTHKTGRLQPKLKTVTGRSEIVCFSLEINTTLFQKNYDEQNLGWDSKECQTKVNKCNFLPTWHHLQTEPQVKAVRGCEEGHQPQDRDQH